MRRHRSLTKRIIPVVKSFNENDIMSFSFGIGNAGKLNEIISFWLPAKSGAAEIISVAGKS